MTVFIAASFPVIETWRIHQTAARAHGHQGGAPNLVHGPDCGAGSCRLELADVTEPSETLERALQRRVDLKSAVERAEFALSSPSGREGWFADAQREIAALRDALHAHVEITEGEDGLFSEIMDTA